MSFFKKRICDNKKCNREYTPKGANQKYCKKCGETNKKKISRKSSNKYNKNKNNSHS